MAAASIVHIVSKDNHANQHLVEVSPNSLPALGPSSIRVRSTLVGLTAIQLSYARAGDVWHWWSAYPAQSYFPVPFNDSAKYGILPAWGFATVLESKVAEIEQGTLICLGTGGRQANIAKKMMPLYNRYMVDSRMPKSLGDEQDSEIIELGWDATTRLIWGCGHLLNSFVFPYDSNIKPVYPLGVDLPWSKEAADLSSTLVVSLSASTRTGLSLTDQLIHNRPGGSGLLGLLAVASKPDLTTLCLDGAPFPTRAVTYIQASDHDTKSWVQDFAQNRPVRVLIIDFGGRGESLANIHAMFTDLGMTITNVAVGTEAKVYTPQELAKSQAEFKRLNKIQSNASPQRQAAIAQLGEQRYFEEMFAEWKRFRARGGFPGMVLKWGDGMIGETGIQGAWKRLCEGTASVGNENMVFRL